MIKKIIATFIYATGILGSSLSVNINLSPAGSFEIKSSDIKGSVTKNGDLFTSKKITVPVKSLSTGLDLRDKHTKEKLFYKKYPTIRIIDANAKEGKGQARLQIMGIEKTISFVYYQQEDSIKVEFSLKLSDFSIEGISYMGIGVKDEIHITANIDVL